MQKNKSGPKAGRFYSFTFFCFFYFLGKEKKG